VLEQLEFQRDRKRNTPDMDVDDRSTPNMLSDSLSGAGDVIAADHDHSFRLSVTLSIMH
jgi:hypothetical protein